MNKRLPLVKHKLNLCSPVFTISYCKVFLALSAFFFVSTTILCGQTNPQNLINLNGTLYFSAQTPAHGRELWKSDGTAAGTVLVKDITAGIGSSTPENLTNVNGTLYFIANKKQYLSDSYEEGDSGYELWKSNGTATGTVKIKDIPLGEGDGQFPMLPVQLVNADGTLYFTANNAAGFYELWKSDGTTAGTTIVKSFVRAYYDFANHFAEIESVGKLVFFTNADGANNDELWRTDGTPAGTFKVSAVPAFAQFDKNMSNLTNVNGTLFFVAYTPENGRELWKSNGTATGTVLVKDITPGYEYENYPMSSEVADLIAVNGMVYFTAQSDVTASGGSRELWRSDGTAAGTILLADLYQPEGLTNVNGTLYFAAGFRDHDLWKSNGTVAGTGIVATINGQNFMRNLTNVNGTLFFTNSIVEGDTELWKSNGTQESTVMVKDIYPGSNSSNSSNPTGLTAVNNTLFFSAFDGTERELWKSNGTTAGTVKVKPSTACIATGTILREYWGNVTGTAVSAIPVNTTPNSTSQLTSFETPSNQGDNYGQRVRGYICAPTTGNYIFYIASDDNSELYLSTDDNPSNKQRIAHISGTGSWATPREWTKFTSQKSATISLVAGKKYYIEALQKEGVGGDNLAVGWILPNTSSIAVISGSYLSPFVPTASSTFLRAINLNGGALNIDNRLYEASSSAANFSFTGRTFTNQTISLVPATDANRATMIRSSIYSLATSPASVNIGGVATGEYELYVYVWEDNNAETYNLSLEGNIVQGNYNSGGAGKWAKLGPFRKHITDGVINLVASGGAANLSGIEIWKVNTTTPTACTATGTILREYWGNIAGTAVSAIPSNTTPTSTSQLTSFETQSNQGDNYGQRVRGYICAPTTGNYTFYIASDDNSELYLSTDDNPSNKQRIAHISGTGSWATPREWTKFTSQKSATISLVAGKKYYIEALQKEGVGGDNLAVGWILPNTSSIAVISGSYLSPFVYAGNARLSSEEAVTTSSMTAYPNPFADKLTLSLAGEERKVVITITDVVGKQHYSTSKQVSAAGEQLELDLSELKAGVYIIKLQAEEGTSKMVRVIKQ